jgi:hypothetical protein
MVALELGRAAMATARPGDLELGRACAQGGARRGGGDSTCDYGGNGSELRERDGHEALRRHPWRLHFREPSATVSQGEGRGSE